jgi:hypothetical protein
MDVEVNPEEALAEGRTASEDVPTNGDQPDQPEAKKEEEVDVLDILKPKVSPKEWEVGPPDKEGERRKYVQAPLSFFAKMEFFSLVGEVIDKALSGDDALRIGSLFEGPQIDASGVFAVSDFSNAEMFFQAVGKLLVYAPDFLEKSYCIWLGVPEIERPWAIAAMREPVDRGGLSDKDGVEIVEIFIDQNWEAIERFFREEIGSLRSRIQARSRQDQDDESPPSRP